MLTSDPLKDPDGLAVIPKVSKSVCPMYGQFHSARKRSVAAVTCCGIADTSSMENICSRLNFHKIFRFVMLAYFMSP